MRVFMTGATGEIGRRAVPLMIAAGHRVTAVSRSAHNRDLLRSQLGATPVEADLFNGASVRRTLVGHDAVVNLATHEEIETTLRGVRALTTRST